MASKAEETITLNGKSYPTFADGKYDIVILGTGLTNSLLAVILSMNKKWSGLHVDQNTYYGGEGASLQLKELFKHFGKKEPDQKVLEDKAGKYGGIRGYNVDLIPKLIMASGQLIEFLVKKNVHKYLEFNVLDASYVYQKGGTIGKVPSSPAEAVKSSLVGFFQKNRLRAFLGQVHSLDTEEIKVNVPKSVTFGEGAIGLQLTPLMKGPGTGILINKVQEGPALDSGRVKAGDFITHVAGKCITGMEHKAAKKFLGDQKRPVTIVFQSPPGKRSSWDLVTHSTQELYKYWKLDEQTQDFVSHAMGLYGDNEHMNQPAFITMAALKLYVNSCMRYQKSPFLFPKYGLSEMPQGFSRLCALQGGVQSLRVGIEEIVIDEKTKKVSGLVLKYEDKVKAVSTQRMIVSPEYLKDDAPSNSTGSGSPSKFAGKMQRTKQVVRSICILNHPLACGAYAKAETVQLILPQKQTGRKNDIYVSCVGHAFEVAPKNFYIAIVSTTVETSTPLKEVEPGIKLLGAIVERFDKVSDVMIPTSGDDGKDSNLFATSSFDASSHFETIIEDVKKVYQRITGEALDLSA